MNPLVTPTPNCGPDLDARQANLLWGGTGTGTGGGGLFSQLNTVETLLIHGPNNQYTDPTGIGGNFSLGMLSSVQDDKLALTLNSQNFSFINLTFNLAGIDLGGCGGPFGLATPVMNVKMYNTPSGTFDFNNPGTLLDEKNFTGVPSASSTFNWASVGAGFNTIGVTNQFITVVFDLTASPYAALDNLIMNASNIALAVDIISFTGKAQPGKNILNWQTVNESNITYFEIQHSIDGRNFTLIDRVNPMNIPSGYSYSYHHNNPGPGTNFYRLYQVDRDNKNKYSQVTKVLNPYKEIESINILSNRASGNLRFSMNANVENLNCKIYNSIGAVVSRKSLRSSAEMQIPVHHLSPGIYRLEVIGGVTRYVATFIR